MVTGAASSRTDAPMRPPAKPAITTATAIGKIIQVRRRRGFGERSGIPELTVLVENVGRIGGFGR
jgi:hypothetical protein